jgi:predicted DNA-binding transcriptional regulator AlpA
MTSPPPSALPAFYTGLVEEARNESSIKTIKIKQAAQKVSASVPAIWVAINLGTFPPPIKVSTRSIAFIEGELDALLAARREMSRTQQSIDLRTFVSMLVAPRQTRPLKGSAG